LLSRLSILLLLLLAALPVDAATTLKGAILANEYELSGLPMAKGGTADKTTLRDFLKKIETQYGKAERIWMMDRGHAACGIIEESQSKKCLPKCVQPNRKSSTWLVHPEGD
jgi:hypothetical protein